LITNVVFVLMPAAPPAGLQRQVTAVGAEDRLQVVVRVGTLISGAAVADLKINNVLRAAVDQVVGVAGPCPKTSAHARLQDGFPLVRNQGGPPLKDINELVLSGVGMAQGRDRSRREPREVDAEIAQPERLAERTLLASGHA
jgi:hypothetical protein